MVIVENGEYNIPLCSDAIIHASISNSLSYLIDIRKISCPKKSNDFAFNPWDDSVEGGRTILKKCCAVHSILVTYNLKNQNLAKNHHWPPYPVSYHIFAVDDKLDVEHELIEVMNLHDLPQVVVPAYALDCGGFLVVRSFDLLDQLHLIAKFLATY